MAVPELACCDPYLAPYPSGHKWTHSRNCTVALNRGQKVRQHDVTPRQDALLRHPAGSDLAGMNPVSVWRSHPTGCVCMFCEYVDHHLDDNDDRYEVLS